MRKNGYICIDTFKNDICNKLKQQCKNLEVVFERISDDLRDKGEKFAREPDTIKNWYKGKNSPYKEIVKILAELYDVDFNKLWVEGSLGINEAQIIKESINETKNNENILTIDIIETKKTGEFEGFTVNEYLCKEIYSLKEIIGLPPMLWIFVIKANSLMDEYYSALSTGEIMQSKCKVRLFMILYYIILMLLILFVDEKITILIVAMDLFTKVICSCYLIKNKKKIRSLVVTN